MESKKIKNSKKIKERTKNKHMLTRNAPISKIPLPTDSAVNF